MLEAIRCKIERCRDPTARYTTYIIYIHTAEAAERLCDKGLVWQAQIFNYEPFAAEARFYRCFRYHRFLYTAKYYKASPKYRHYIGVSHLGGEEECP